ncbi:uncharacterized protein MP3633_1258 [Marinomonas primoryensis]|uniref:Uncharacterized protein n=1 Tax=Marinomonas primoryensis TaxID=178399 RepID=A0A859CVC2_9GAMM|nr:uncharacterized protein MP3633_1258 [Marinomonas primoryensis]
MLLKANFWLLFGRQQKVTRSAERNKGREFKAFEWNLKKVLTPS